jgi:NitT/TauT family transport system ATP-binding protein
MMPPANGLDRVQAELQNVAPVKLLLDRVSKSYHSKRGETLALQNVRLEINEGEYVCLVGRSGCGKTTLLNLIAALDFPDSGRILVDGKPVERPGRDRMVMFQEPALFPWLDVLGNVLFGLKLKPNLTKKDRLEVARFYINMVGLKSAVNASIHELSGGMKQRVALARALAPNPRVLLMDEPFGALDALTREQLYGDIQDIWLKRRKTIVFVTHNVREAVCLGDRVVLLAPSPGRVVEEFKIDIPRPRDINSVALAEYATRITRALKGYDPGKEVAE